MGCLGDQWDRAGLVIIPVVSPVFPSAVKGAGVVDPRWPDFRHYLASQLVTKVVELRTVRELMGHKMLAMKLRYSHLSPAHQLEAVQRLNQQTASPTATSREAEKKAIVANGEVLDISEDLQRARKESNPRPAGSKPDQEE